MIAEGGAQGAAPVWAIVVHFGTSASTHRTLHSLRAGRVRPDQLLVVDNQGGWDDESGDVIVVRPGTNLGFAGGAAEGAREALAGGAAWLWFVNNDAVVAAGCLGALVDAAARLPDVGMLSPLIVYGDGGLWYAGAVVEPRSSRVSHLTTPPSTQRPFDTGYVTGCAMFVRAAALEAAGLPDARLFMYLEDVDLSLRVRQQGWRLMVVPTALVTHDVERRDQRRVFSPDSVYLITRNRIVLAGRRGTPVRALPPALAWSLRQVVKAAHEGMPWQVVVAAAQGLRDGLRGVAGPPPGGRRA
jgi:GT2 family glycosyltransferase